MIKYLAPKITVNPGVRFGKPVIAGTRIPVDLVVGKIAGGMDISEVEKEFDLTEEEIRAALRYAADLVAGEDVSLV